MTYEASKIWVLVLRGRKIHLYPTQKKSRRLLFRTDLKDRAKVIRTKARMGHLVRRVDDMLFLPTAWTLSTGLPTKAGIPSLWGTLVSIISETS